MGLYGWTVQDIDRKNEQTAIILKRQADQIIELEALYKEEQILRKRYFNMMEGNSYMPLQLIWLACCFSLSPCLWICQQRNV